MKMIKAILLIMGLVLVSNINADVELYDIYPNCFDYVFRGETILPNGKTMLTFEDLKFKKVVLNVGDKLRNLTIKSYDKGDKNSKVNADGDIEYTKPKIASVTLATNDGKELVLPLNQPVYFPGYLGKFIDTETIVIQIARDKGVVNDGANLCTVTSISSNEVILAYRDNSKIYNPMTKAKKDALSASVKEMKKAQVVKDIKKYDKITRPPEVQLSEGYQEYRDFIFVQTKEQANQQAMDIQEFNTRRNDAKRKMAEGHSGSKVQQAKPIDTKYSTSDSDYEDIKDGNYREREKKEKHKIKEEEKKDLKE